MMLKPSIDSLLDRVNSKYSLVILASKRAHELDASAQPTLLLKLLENILNLHDLIVSQLKVLTS